MQLKMGPSDSIILTCWTTVVAKQEKNVANQPYFVQKELHLHMKDNHLFIGDNCWHSMSIKRHDHGRFPSGSDWGKSNKATIASKPMLFDGIAIDLTKNDECKSIATARKKKETKEVVEKIKEDCNNDLS